MFESIKNWFSQRFRSESRNRSMLLQFRGTMESIVKSISSEEISNNNSFNNYIEKANEIIKKERFSWNDAYQLEKILAHIRPSESLEFELDKQISSLKTVDPGDLYKNTWEQIKKEFDACSEENKRNILISKMRYLLERVLNDVHWKYAQRYQNRRIVDKYTMTICAISVIISVMFFVLLFFISKDLTAFAPYAGLGVALVSGLLGASFSILTGPMMPVVGISIEEMLRRTGLASITLRIGVGGIGAIIFYFFFESGILTGNLLPNLEGIGFIGTNQAVLSAEDIANMLSLSAATAPGAVELNGNMVNLLQDESNRESLAEFILEKLSGAQNGTSESGAVQFGSMVPNSDLSKLMVWSFGAGFFEKLVPTMLGRVNEQSE